MNKEFGYLKLPPQREKMTEQLEFVRSCEIRLKIVQRDYPDSREAKRLTWIYNTLWDALDHQERRDYRTYMEQ